MSSAKTSSVNIGDLFSTKNLIISTFRELGLLVFDQNDLTLVSVTPPTDLNCPPLYHKVTTISFTHKIPPGSDICELIPSESGKFVVVCGLRLVFVLELPREFWDFQSILSSRNLTTFRRKYETEAYLVNPNLQLSRKSLLVEKVAWLTSAQSKTFHACLGVLYSDNKLRIYHVTKSKSQPAALVDFNRVLPSSLDGTVHNDQGHGYGLVTKIISFDFGMEIDKGKENDAYQSVIAVDSDGDIYYAEYGLNYTSVCRPQGPLPFVGASPASNSAVSGAEDVVFVNHAMSKSLPVFAFCSDRGEICHAFLAPNKAVTVDEPTVSLVVLDSASIQNWYSKNPCVYMRRDPNELGQYILINERQVYYVDLKAVISSVVDSNGSGRISPSTVRLLFESVSPEQSFLSSVSLLVIERPFGVSLQFMTLLAVLDSDNNYWANLIHKTVKKTESSSSPVKAPLPQNNLRQQIAQKVAQNVGFPHISGMAKLSPEMKSDLMNKLLGQARFLKELTEFVQRYGDDIQRRLQNIVQCKNQANDRLYTIFVNIRNCKQRIAQSKQGVDDLDKRFGRIIDIIEERSYNLKDDEVARSSMEAIRKQCCDYQDEINSANGKLLSLRAKLNNPSRPFQASVNAQKFMLTKNTVEIAELENQLKRLETDLTNLS